MRTEWSNSEINYLNDLYVCSGLTASELYPLFKINFNRSLTSVKIKIKRLKLRHTNQQTKEAKSRLYSGELNGMYGKIGPNFGKTKYNCERIKVAGEKISIDRKEKIANGNIKKMVGEKNGMFGKKSWNNGLTKYDDIRIFNYGLKLSKAAKFRWNELTEEQKTERIGNLTKCATMARKNTKIESIVEDSLKELNIKHIKNYKKERFVFDFYLPDFNHIIECQGDYWHANPIIYENKKLSNTQLFNIERDKRKIQFINSKKFNYSYFWENFIFKNHKKLKDIILEDISKNNNVIHI
jgi:G:T-mismatch repair DNA endonuclease (very short patch repair protein)